MSKAAWVSEDGDPIAVGRVQRIRLAQDALSPTEEAVYNLLWGSQPGKDDVASRSVQAGYDFIMKRTRLSKKTVQRVIDKLAGKGFLEIEIPPDIYRRISTIYRVYSYRTILDRQAEKGRYYVARIGPGVVYARQREETGQTDMTTVDKSEGELDPTTVVNLTTPTVVKLTPVTVVRKNLTTVVKMTTLNLEQSTIEDFGKGREGEDSSSSLETVVRSLGFFGSVDDDAAIRLIGQCRENAPDCTVEEIVWFIHEKGQLTRPANNRIYNPIGFLLTAVPKCFVGENLQLFRQEQARLRAEQERRELETQEELAAFQAENERILNDPGVTEEERQWARRMLGLDRSPDQE